MKTFKNRMALTILSVFFIGILATSCSNADDTAANTPTDTSGSILGRWALTKRSYITNGIVTPELDYENNQPGCALNDYFEFKDNNVLEIGYYDPNCAVTPKIGEWTKTNNNILFSYPADPDEEDITFELLSLTSTEMKLRADLTGREGTEPGVILFINYTLVKVN